MFGIMLLKPLYSLRVMVPAARVSPEPAWIKVPAVIDLRLFGEKPSTQGAVPTVVFS